MAISPPPPASRAQTSTAIPRALGGCLPPVRETKLGTWIRTNREILGLSQNHLAHDIGVTGKAISVIESGVRDGCNARTLLLIASRFQALDPHIDVSVARLLDLVNGGAQ